MIEIEKKSSFLDSYKEILKDYEVFDKDCALFSKEEQKHFLETIEKINKIRSLSLKSFGEKKESVSSLQSFFTYVQSAVILSISHQVGTSSKGMVLASIAAADLLNQTVKNSCGWETLFFPSSISQETKNHFAKKVEQAIEALTTMAKLYQALSFASSFDPTTTVDLIEQSKEILKNSIPTCKGIYEISQSLSNAQLEKMKAKISQLNKELECTRMDQKESIDLLAKILEETSKTISLLSKLSDQITSSTL